MSVDDTGFGIGNLGRGNPTQVQQWVDGSSYLTTTMLYDTTGQVVQSVDPAGNPTCYNYADNFFNENGPSSMSSYSPPAPTNAYPKTVTMGGLTSTFGYYFGSGKRAFATDSNNATTSYFFSDPSDRSTETLYPIGWELANYTSATQADSYIAVGDTSASSGCTTAGRVQSVSHAYVNTTDPSHVFETFAYDGADRKIAITHPDNQSLQTAFGSNVSNLGGVTTQQSSATTYGYGYPVISMDEASKQRQQWIDGFGQIIEVDEPSITSSTPGTGTVTIDGFEQRGFSCTDREARVALSLPLSRTLSTLIQPRL